MSKDASVVSENGSTQRAHLFVLVHGLWGGPNHMLTIEKCIKTLVDDSGRKVVTLKVSSFRFWKTYDGLKMNAEKVITELLYEIEALRSKNNMIVDRISLVGYSLGGLISRYVIGLLEEMGFFDTVKPVFFTTFATPHVGIEFFNKGIFDFLANSVGKYLFGPSGTELFLKKKTLVDMADPNFNFYKGLIKFEKHILLANVRNDRTVAFFTSYITEYAPFSDWKHVKIKYMKGLPVSKINNAKVKPKFVDLEACHKIATEDLPHFRGNLQEEPSIWTGRKSTRIAVFTLGVLFLFPIWIPFVLMTSSVVSVYSFVKIKFLKPQDITGHWKRVLNTVYGMLPVSDEDARMGQYQRDRRRHLSRHESFKGDTSEMTENAMDNVMFMEERFSRNREGEDYHEVDEDEDDASEAVVESDDSSELSGSESTGLFKKKAKTVLEINKAENDERARAHLEKLKDKDVSKRPLFTEETRLKMGKEKKFIVDNLNRIDWVKIPVYLDCLNAHDAIVSRRGPAWHPRGTSTVGLWCSILRNHLEGER